MRARTTINPRTIAAALACAAILATVSARPAHADTYSFVGGTTVLPSYGDHTTDPAGGGSVPNGYSYDLSGAFSDPSAWQDFDQAYSPAQGLFPTSAPGANDNVLIGGLPQGELPLVLGPPDNSDPLNPVYGYVGNGVSPGGALGFTGDGFHVSGAGGAIASLAVSGPGTLSLTDLTVSGSTQISSTGGVPLLTIQQGGDIESTGFAGSDLTISGGTLSTPSLTLFAGTLLTTAFGDPDPNADAGSLTIDGATLNGDTTRIFALDPNTADPTIAWAAAPIELTNATLNARTELDIIGADPIAFPTVLGTTTLSASGSTIKAGMVVIGTGPTGLGSGSAEAAAELDLADNSQLTATDVGSDTPSLVVGDTGDGTLDVQTGSTVTAEDAVVGNADGSTGTVTIDASTFTIHGALTVGKSGIGALTVLNKGSLTADSTTIGGEADGIGELTITGEGTTASLGDTTIGDAGNGTLTVSGNATIDTGDITIGAQENSVGNLVIVDDTANVTVNGDLTIGDQALGTTELIGNVSLMADSITVGASSNGGLSLGAGSSVTTSGDVAVGDEQSGIGNLAVGLGGAAQMTVGGDLTVGGKGFGSLQVDPGSSLTIQGGSFTIGDEDTGDGQVTLSGGSFTFGGDLAIGDSGAGELIMQQGAKNNLAGTSLATPSVKIGDKSSASGTLSLDGKGTALQVSDLTVGVLGKGTLNLSNQALLTSNGDVSIADQLSGHVSTAAIQSSAQLAINGDLTVGGGGVATLTINTGGSANAIGDVTLGDNPNASGAVTVDGVQPTTGAPPPPGKPSSLGWGGTLAVGHFGAGSLTITGGAFVAPTPHGLGEIDIAAENAGIGTLSVSGSDPASNTPSTLLANAIAVGGTLNSGGGIGQLTVGPQAIVRVSSTLQLWTSGALDVTGGGSVTVGAGPDADPGALRINPGGTLGGGGSVSGDVANDGGTVAPGDPMSLDIHGDYLQNGGTLDLQFAGTAPSQYDHLMIDGNLAISGNAALELDFLDGFLPRTGDTFTFIDFGSIDPVNNAFATVDIEGLAPGFQYTLLPTANDAFTLTALNDAQSVPEPATCLLLAAGAAYFAARRRRPA
ncbi:MAG TPA: PEP-CTERM sorting domain-containing protein [Phycisphaerae bacterium]|nr:PEP-CTERM sorting domain-containing protein [Phycisphaerae bacterium]